MTVMADCRKEFQRGGPVVQVERDPKERLALVEMKRYAYFVELGQVQIAMFACKISCAVCADNER